MGGIAHIPVSVLLEGEARAYAGAVQQETIARWIVQAHVAALTKKLKRPKP